MMSVFCSKTLIFAPECWKCIVRGLDFINFPEGGRGGEGYAPRLPWKQVQAFSISAFFKAFATYLKPY